MYHPLSNGLEFRFGQCQAMAWRGWGSAVSAELLHRRRRRPFTAALNSVMPGSFGHYRGGCFRGHRASGRAHWLLHGAPRGTSSATGAACFPVLQCSRTPDRTQQTVPAAWLMPHTPGCLGECRLLLELGLLPNFCVVRSQLGWVSSAHDGQRFLVDDIPLQPASTPAAFCRSCPTSSSSVMLPVPPLQTFER
jgi:hypothetical protein